jgi:5-hydroxyisourate hydrolase-like protein (transthyretin family)
VSDLKPGGISIHVFDVSRGIAAAGLRVELCGPDGKLLASGTINAAGVLDHPTVRGEGLTATGIYEAVFHVGEWYRAQGVAIPHHNVTRLLEALATDMELAEQVWTQCHSLAFDFSV